MEEQVTNRLGVVDKRELFQVLISMVERLLYLNKFPVDQEDFALSLQSPEVEAAWKLLRKTNKRTLSPSHTQIFDLHGQRFQLHNYPEDKSDHNQPFIDAEVINLENARRHMNVVNIWCTRQVRLEDQLLRACGAIKSIVHSCNTVGQYKRVSPDLLTFLPEKYRDALKHYTKTSPYPETSASLQEIEAMLATMAHAAMQPMHSSEEVYKSRMTSYYKPSYHLEAFPRRKDYDGKDVRRLQI